MSTEPQEFCSFVRSIREKARILSWKEDGECVGGVGQETAEDVVGVCEMEKRKAVRYRLAGKTRADIGKRDLRRKCCGVQ
ncbi:hypothetical protein Trydic_g2030 [Trypoxylus dichotomus]